MISGSSEDCLSLRSILSHTNWLVHWVADRYEALLFLQEHDVPVILCPKELPDGDWSELLDAVRCFPNPPNVLVYSDRADRRFGIAVLNAGGYDWLLTPLQQDEVLRAISMACRAWHHDARQRQNFGAAAMTA
jgi:DNA-binding response OmpR family regulator